MKIAQVAPLCISVPPAKYGGTERVVSILTEALVELGHDVDLYASGDSVTTANLIPIGEKALWSYDEWRDANFWHTILLGKLLRNAYKYDIVHFHLDILPLPLQGLLPCASLNTQHGRLDQRDLDKVLHAFPLANHVSISLNQQNQLPNLHWVGNVYHGIPQNLYRLEEKPEDYFVFIGRINTEKGPEDAVKIAIAHNTKLKIAAKIEDMEFFNKHKELFEHPLVEMVGLVDDREKQTLIGKAKALLFPIKWPEPFGIVMIEAMACGTPVIAYKQGSVPEVIDDGVTGFVVETLEEAIEAAGKLDQIYRVYCRAEFDRRFTDVAMAQNYESVYNKIIRKNCNEV